MISLGVRCIVPFGNRKAIGFVVALTQEDEDFYNDGARGVASVDVLDNKASSLMLSTLEQPTLLGFELQDVQQKVSGYTAVPTQTPKKKRLKELEEVLTEPYFTDRGARLALIWQKHIWLPCRHVYAC